jgi:hypothetical protein
MKPVITAEKLRAHAKPHKAGNKGARYKERCEGYAFLTAPPKPTIQKARVVQGWRSKQWTPDED